MSDALDVDRAMVLLSAGDLAGARRLLTARTHEAPDDEDARVAMMLVAGVAGDQVAAEQGAYRAVQSPRTRPAGAWVLAGVLDARSGRADEGVQWAAEAVRLEPASASMRAMLAARLYDVGHKEEALEQSRGALMLASADPEELIEVLLAHVRLCLREVAWHPEGHDAAQRVLAMDPTNVGAGRAVALFETSGGQGARGLVTILDAVRRDPSAPGAEQLIATVLWTLERRLAIWSTVVAFAVNILGVGALGTLLPITTAVRLTGVFGIVAMLATWALCVLPVLRSPGNRRAAWRAATTQGRPRVGLVIGALVLLVYAITGTGAAFYGIGAVPFVLLVLIFIGNIPPKPLRRRSMEAAADSARRQRETGGW